MRFVLIIIRNKNQLAKFTHNKIHFDEFVCNLFENAIKSFLLAQLFSLDYLSIRVREVASCYYRVSIQTINTDYQYGRQRLRKAEHHRNFYSTSSRHSRQCCLKIVRVKHAMILTATLSVLLSTVPRLNFFRARLESDSKSRENLCLPLVRGEDHDVEPRAT